MSTKKVTDEELLRVYEETGSKKKTSELLEIGRWTVQTRLKKLGVNTQDESLDGLIQNKKPFIEDLPEEGQVFRYLVTSAQNNTKVNRGFWENLLALSDYYVAPILVSQFTYNKAQYKEGSVKPGTSRTADGDDLWYDPLIEEHVENRRVQLAPGLVFVGDMNVLPTAVRPLSGLQNFTGRASGIFPHAKIEMESVASVGNEPAKFNYTTGCVTQRNYIQKKEGQKAEFNHAYGALIVEVDHEGNWWVRQLNADGRNRVCDVNVMAEKGEVKKLDRVEALTPGDIHASEIDWENAAILWGFENSVVDTLRPKYQFLHDLFSMRSRSHHELKSFHRMMEKHLNAEESVVDELKETVRLCNDMLTRPWMKSIVVDSNHDRHLYQWLDQQDYRKDFCNAEFFLEAQLTLVRRMKAGTMGGFNLLEWSMKKFGLKKEANMRFLGEDESFVTCKRYGGGIENGLHGDRAGNGARGSLNALLKLARKLIIGHSHSAGINGGVYQTGTSSRLRLEYNKGPSSWSHTHCITFPNGKRQLFTVWAGRPWASRAGL